MNKTELIAAVAEDVGVGKKDPEQVLNGAGDLETERQGTDPWLRQL